MRITNLRLLVLAFVTAGLFCWAVLQAHFSRPDRMDAVGGYLLQGIDEENIYSIVIRGGQTPEELTLRRAGATRFAVQPLDGYPATSEKVVDLLVELSSIRPVGKVTDDQDKHAELGVTPETADLVVDLRDAEDKRIAALAIGRQPQSPDAFVRLLDKPTVYRVEGGIRVATRPLDYVDASLTEQIEMSQIQRITVGTEQMQLQLTRQGRQWEAGDLPEGKKLDSDRLQSLLGTVGRLRFQDVFSARSPKAEDLAFDRRLMLLSESEMGYAIQLGTKDGNTYAMLTAGGLSSEADASNQPDQTPEQAAMQRRIGQFAGRHDGWVYQLSSFQGSSLTEDLSGLLKDKPEETSEDGSESTGDGDRDPAASPPADSGSDAASDGQGQGDAQGQASENTAP